MQKVQFHTSDQIRITGDFYEPNEPSAKGAVLVHMMPAAKESWRDFAAKLQTAGFQALAIDLRGHGESGSPRSSSGAAGGGDYRQFSDAEHQASIHDLEAAAEFLKQKGVNELHFAGASIGANLSLQYLAQNPETKSVILFSPGLDYRGIETAPLAARVPDKYKILFVGAKDDEDTMGASCEEIIQKLGLAKSLIYDSGGHGTNLFQSHPELSEKLIEFLK